MNVRSMIRELGGSGEVARALDLPPASGAASVRGWVARDSVPPRWFNRLAALADSRSAHNITVDALLLHAEKRQGPRGNRSSPQQQQQMMAE